MTMPHIARSFAISLHVRHPEIDPAELTTALTAHHAGTQRRTPKGEPLQGIYATSYWSHRFQLSPASDLTEHLQLLAFQLRDHEPVFRRIISEQGSVELFCGIFAEGNWDEVISCELMRSLAQIQVALRLDVYPSKQKGDSPGD